MRMVNDHPYGDIDFLCYVSDIGNVPTMRYVMNDVAYITDISLTDIAF